MLVSKFQAISAIKEGFQNEIAETKGLIDYTDKVEIEVVRSVEVKAEQAKEAVVLSKADREATVVTPTIEREPTPVIAEEPKKIKSIVLMLKKPASDRGQCDRERGARKNEATETNSGRT